MSLSPKIVAALWTRKDGSGCFARFFRGYFFVFLLFAYGTTTSICRAQSVHAWVGADGNGGDGVFTDKKNWNPNLSGKGSTANALVIFNGSSGGDVSLGNGLGLKKVTGMEFTATAGEYTFTESDGGSPQLFEIGEGGIKNSSTSIQTFGVDVRLNADQAWYQVDQSRIVFERLLDIQGNNVSIGGGEVVIDGAVSGSGTIVVESGKVTMNGDTSGLTGNISLFDGTLEVNTVMQNLGTLDLAGGNLVVNNQNISADTFSLSGIAAITLDNTDGISQNISLGDAIYNSGSLTIYGWMDGPNGDTISFDTDPGDEFLQNVTFDGFGQGALWIDGFLVPIPEPSTITLILGGAVFAVFVGCRRKRS
jgi:hypothetical protein